MLPIFFVLVIIYEDLLINHNRYTTPKYRINTYSEYTLYISHFVLHLNMPYTKINSNATPSFKNFTNFDAKLI